MRNIWILLALLFSIKTVNAQDSFKNKFEREYSIKQSEVPLEASNFIKETLNGKVKWYGEENLNGKAIEAKGKKEGKLYSVKFDTFGKIQDIEVVVNFKSLSEELKNRIQKELEQYFSSIKIIKTQIQWRGSQIVLKQLINKENTTEDYLTNYEIVIRGKENNRSEYYEILFNEQGKIIDKAKIIQKNDHHLIY